MVSGKSDSATKLLRMVIFLNQTKVKAHVVKIGNKLELAFVGIILLVNFSLIMYTSQITLRDFPNSGDEYAYLVSAKIFSEGKLSVPSHKLNDFFNFWHIINDGKYYGKYPPGWPLILSLGVLLNVPWIINPLIGLLTMVLIYLIARENFSKDTALFAIFLTLFNAFFIFNSASYFSHASAMFFIALFVYFYFRYLDNASENLNYVFMGIAGGFALLIRPYTAMASLLPFGLHFLYRSIRSQELRKSIKGVLLAVLFFGLFISAYLGYNYAQTGDPFLQPYMKYHNQKDIVPSVGRDLPGMMKNQFFRAISELHKWLPFLLVIISIHLFSDKSKKKTLLLLLFASLFIFHFLIGFSVGNAYGPRYNYESSFALFILAAFSLDKLINKRQVIFGILIIVLFFNISQFYDATIHHSNQVRERMQLYDLVREQNISNAVVFLRGWSGSMDPGDLKRNGIYFNESVLYVSDFGENKNKALMNAYSGREFYVFEDKQLVKYP